jgi:holo-[acyl-carrier protein] synthase
MIYGIGLDLVQIERFEKINKERFVRRFFGELEIKELNKRGIKNENVAALFAVKEAFSKAIGTGVRNFSLNEVETLHDENGKPFIYLSGRAKEIADNLSLQFSVSISHEKSVAAAIVLAFKKEW